MKRKRKYSPHFPIGQSTCAICKKPARPGAGIVRHYGKGGRVHVKCESPTSVKNAEQ